MYWSEYSSSVLIDLPAVAAIRQATLCTAYEGQIWLVGGAVRDDLLGLRPKGDFDLVLEGSAIDLADFLSSKGVSSIKPVEYPRFGTALIRVQDTQVELVCARRESYSKMSRKPNVEGASLADDALRRDFTVNTLLRNLHTGELLDPLGIGIQDLESQTLRTPLDPKSTFHEDPLRMLRAIRFRWQLSLDPVPELTDALRSEAPRLAIVSAERIRDEWLKMLVLDGADRPMRNLMEFGLLRQFIPEFEACVGVDQGKHHHLDVWDHTLLALRNVTSDDVIVRLAVLFHDIGKPQTRFVDANSNVRFFRHEVVGEEITKTVLKRLRFTTTQIRDTCVLVRNHMRLGSSKTFTPSAARRLIRDLGELTDLLVEVAEADGKAHRPGSSQVDIARIRAVIAKVIVQTPRRTLESPLSGEEIMDIAGISSGRLVGLFKESLKEAVLEGKLLPTDKAAAMSLLQEMVKQKSD